MDEDKQALIDLIIWYRDEYHKTDWCHSDMIGEINKTTDPKVLETYWQLVDGWID